MTPKQLYAFPFVHDLCADESLLNTQHPGVEKRTEAFCVCSGEEQEGGGDILFACQGPPGGKVRRDARHATRLGEGVFREGSSTGSEATVGRRKRSK